MTDGTEDPSLVASQIETTQREYDARRAGLKSGAISRRDEAFSGVPQMVLPSAPPPPKLSPDEAWRLENEESSDEFAASETSEGVPPAPVESDLPSPVFGSVRIVVTAIMALILIIAWRSYRRARKEAEHG